MVKRQIVRGNLRRYSNFGRTGRMDSREMLWAEMSCQTNVCSNVSHSRLALMICTTFSFFSIFMSPRRMWQIKSCSWIESMQETVKWRNWGLDRTVLSKFRYTSGRIKQNMLTSSSWHDLRSLKRQDGKSLAAIFANSLYAETSQDLETLRK